MQYGVLFKVGNVQAFALGDNFRMFFAQQPTDVREEEASADNEKKEILVRSSSVRQSDGCRVNVNIPCCVMWIGIGFGIFMVNTMIASPM